MCAQGQYHEAVKICRLGLLGKPTAVDGRVVLGQALLALRRYDEVLAEIRRAERTIDFLTFVYWIDPPLAPEENRLTVPITAGELKYH